MKRSIRLSVKVSVMFLLASMVFALGLNGSLCVWGGDDVSSRIATAGDALQRAFVAVLEAENAGANVSDLLRELDVAGKNLTEAEMAYKSGGLIEAASKAEQCSAVANGVVDEALALKSSASVDARSATWQALTFSGVASFVFLTVLILVWILFKRFHSGKLLGMKPEAGS